MRLTAEQTRRYRELFPKAKRFVKVKGVCWMCLINDLLPVPYGTENISPGVLCLRHSRFYCTRHFKRHKVKYHKA